MKIRLRHIALIAALTALFYADRTPRHAAQTPPPLRAEPPPDKPRPSPPDPEPTPPRPEPQKQKPIPAPVRQEQPTSKRPAPRPTPATYWTTYARRFERQQAALQQESNKARRKNLIRAMSAYVRIDTPTALDWAMSLTDPEEQRAALEAINKNALVGIGAHIRVDETGLPKIMETTVLSALGSTGKAEPGDYISGIVNADGSIVNFKGRPEQQIVNQLRGEAGSEIMLQMERTADDGSTYFYTVPITRSMIVVQPPQE